VIANYGYQDGSGAYFITIDTDRCVECEGRWCVSACPRALFVIETDDYDDDVAAIVVGARRRVKEECSGCKGAHGYESLPCTTACRPGAVSHSW
jgi:ferredoxin